MSFIEQAAKVFSKTAEFKFQAVLFGRDAFYIESARPVKIDDTEMIFKAPNALISVCGEHLAVKELSSDCAAVTGKITGFTVNDL